MTRHERRKLDDETLIEVEIVGGTALLERPELLQAAMVFASAIPTTQPVCLTCEETWTSLKQPPPAAFVFLTPFGTDEIWSLSALCSSCAALPDLHERCTASFQEHWPDSRSLGVAHRAHGRVQ